MAAARGDRPVRSATMPEPELTPYSLLGNEKGAVVFWVGMTLAVLIAFAGLATDIPYLYVARHQAQTAADAGAIAGAYGLLLSPAQATTDGQAFASRTPIIGQFLASGQIDIALLSSTGSGLDQVQCTTYRTLNRGNPMPLFLLPILQIFGLGRTSADVSATATAQIFNTCSTECFKPWSIADRWNDVNGNGQFDEGIDQYDPVGTGYQYPADNGLQVVLKVGPPGGTITPGFFYAVDFPPLNRGTPITGAAQYQQNISTCGPGSYVEIGDQLQVEPGRMVGPTKFGTEALIAQDPTAYWDGACGCVNSPYGATSPRMIRMAFFDPRLPVVSGRTFVTVVKIGGFFVEEIRSNGDVVGRYTAVVAFGGVPNDACNFLKLVQLVR